MASYIKKAKVQIDDIAFNKLDFRANVLLLLRIVNRRRIPLPAAVYDFFNTPGDETSEDMGSENFLAPYMLPEPGKSFVDVGANVGCWAFYVAKRGFEVYAFEPGPKAFSQMKERSAKYPNLHPYPYALGDTDRIGRLGFAAFDKGGVVDQEINLPGGGTVNVAIRKLDSLSLPAVGVIKIDTEGYETPILQGAKETIQKYKPRLVIEVHKQTGKAAQTFEEEKHRIEKILESLGYTWTLHCRQISLHDEMQPFLIGKPI
ncbi:MAG: FkbM family methyltransferase [Candidatus Bathyarchaeia archaeon]